MQTRHSANPVESLIKRFVRLAFGIHEGEFVRAMLMQLNIFLIVLTLLIIKPVSNALFLSNAGVEQLPVVFVLVAVVAMIVSSIYARELGRVRLNVIIQSTIGIAVVSLAVLGILLHLNLPGVWVYYVFYIVVALFGLVATSQVWILASLLFNSREATRLFGFIGAGAIAGGISGGYVTTVFAPVIGSENLVFVAAVLLAGCIPLSAYIWRKNIRKLTILQQRRRMHEFGEHPLRLIRNSRHLVYLASIVGVGVVVAKLVDFQFSAMASASITSEDELAAFFGFWFSTFNVVSLLIQLFLTPRIVGLYGVGQSLFVLPVAILLGAGLLLILPILPVAIFVKASDVTLKQSINKSSTELLALPIPISIKNQTKSFIDIFVDSAATGIGGLALIFIVSGLDFSVRMVSLLIIPLVLIWILFAMGVREEYLKLFKRRISATEAQSDMLETMDSESIVGGLRRILQSGDVKQILFVLRKTIQQKEARLMADVGRLLWHDSAVVRAAALETLSLIGAPDVESNVKKLVSDPDPEVRANAVEYLIERSGLRRRDLVEKYLEHPDDAVSGAALVAVAQGSRNNPRRAEIFDLDRRLKERLRRLQEATDRDDLREGLRDVISAIGKANLANLYPVLDAYMTDSDPEIVDQAIISAAATMNARFVPGICQYLGDPKHRRTAISALADCGKGIFDVLYAMMEGGQLSVETLRWLPKVAERIDAQESVRFLFRLIDHDETSVQVEALRSLNNAKINYPHLRVDRKDVIELIADESRLYLDTIAALYAETRLMNGAKKVGAASNPDVDAARKSLIGQLEQRLDLILERIFRLLGLRYPPEEIIPIYQGIHSNSKDLRTNSVEYLDNLLYGNLKKILIPIVETAMLQTISEETIKALRIDVPNQRDCFEMILKGRDVKLKLAVLSLIEQMGDRSLQPLVQQYTRDRDPRIRDSAQRAESRLVEAASD